MYFKFYGKIYIQLTTHIETMINWKFLPRRDIYFSFHKAFSRKHQGEYAVQCWKGFLGYSRPVGKNHFFKTKEEAYAFIVQELKKDSWIE